ncbi:MAG: MFS transporter, partial [Rhodospirillales bacterium]|nr:MFS transporter [Rhodospirillales bacterium]
FLLIAKGAQVETVGFALALIFAGGAAGKLICGLAAERVGIIRTVVLTEVATGAGILVLVFLPLGWALALLPLVGAALNGTSSVLYGTVGDFVAAERRSRAFGLFYTLGIGAGALSPVAFGLLSDHSGIETTLLVLGCVAFLTLPLCQVLRPSLVAAGAAPE